MLTADEIADALSDAAQHLKGGGDIETLLFNLRRRGADKIDSIKVIRASMGFSTAQAKSLVDRSETWSDRYAQDQAFHAALKKGVSELSHEVDEPEIVVDEQSPDPQFGDK